MGEAPAFPAYAGLLSTAILDPIGKFPLTLTFEKAGNISVTVPVQAVGAMQDKGGMNGMGGMQDGKSGGSIGNMEMK